MTTSLKQISPEHKPAKPSTLALLCVATPVLAALAACDGNSQPFEEQAEVLTLDLVSVDVVGPPNIAIDDSVETNVFINQDQQLELGLRGTDSTGNTVTLDSADRRWVSSDNSVVTVDSNGIATGREDGTANITVLISNIVSAEFTLQVQDSELVEIFSIEGSEEIERCLPQPYFAVGLFADTTERTLFDTSFSLNQGSTAILDEVNQTTVNINANTAGAVTLIAQSGSAGAFSRQITVLDTLNSVSVSPNPLSTNVDDETNFTATGTYVSLDGLTTRTVDITDNIDWAVDETSGGEGRIDSTGDSDPGEFTAEQEGTVVVQAFCGPNVLNTGTSVTVDIDDEADEDDDDEDDDDG